MAAKKTEPVKEVPEVRIVRKGMVLHKERQNSRGQTVSDIYDGDDPDNNMVELLPSEIPKYVHQLEASEEELAAEVIVEPPAS